MSRLGKRKAAGLLVAHRPCRMRVHLMPNTTVDIEILRGAENDVR
jgi:hypothetical protein